MTTRRPLALKAIIAYKFAKAPAMVALGLVLVLAPDRSLRVARRVTAEALLDSLVQVTGVPEPFGGAPAGFTAKQLPDAEVQSDFLALFGKAARVGTQIVERQFVCMSAGGPAVERLQ